MMPIFQKESGVSLCLFCWISSTVCDVATSRFVFNNIFVAKNFKCVSVIEEVT